MFDHDEYEEVFSEGFREPGDDTVRLAYYILFVAAFCGCATGFVLELYGFITAKHGLTGKDIGLDIAVTIVCFVICVAIGCVFAKEVKHWNLKKLSADKVVAGGFMLGIAVAYLGFRMGGAQRFEPQDNFVERALLSFGGAGIGIAICLLSLTVGLIYAFREKFQERPRKVGQLMIDRRYGLDANLVEHENHPCPWEDGMRAMVICRTSDGKRLKLLAGENAYDLADPGKVGAAVTRGSKLQEFHPKR